MKDPFAKERAVFQAKKKPEKQPEPVDDFTLRFFKPLLASLKGDLEPLIKANKGEKGDTPIKGKDYFTKEEITAIKDEVLSRIPTPENGKDAEVNYDLILAYVTEQVSKLPKAQDGQDGKDAVIDYAKVVADVLKQIPKTEKLTVDYKKIQELIDEKVKTIPWNEKRVVGYSSLKQLTDVILDGVPQDAKGNYLLGTGGTGGGHTIEDEGTPLTQRTKLNFVGAGVSVTDDAGDDATVVTINSGSGIVETIVAGTGITVDDTDPANPIVALDAATQASLTKLGHITVTQAVDLDQMEADIAALANGMVYKGNWDASAGSFPGSGAAQIGWFYTVSVGGTVDGVVFVAGDRLIAIVDNASTTTYAANWTQLDATDAVQSVAGKTGNITLVKGDVGLGNVDNTTDLNKPISTATQTALDAKPTISSGAGAPASTPTKVGDIYIDTTGDDAYIAVGTASSADWEKTNDGAGGGAGDVVGPASATDNALARFDSTTGKLLQDSTVSASDVAAEAVTLSSIGNNDLILQTGNATTGNITLIDGANANIELNPNGTGKVVSSKDLEVPDEAYDATAWNGSLEVPTKNAVRDKIESLSLSSETTAFVSNGGWLTEVEAYVLAENLGYDMEAELKQYQFNGALKPLWIDVDGSSAYVRVNADVSFPYGYSVANQQLFEKYSGRGVMPFISESLGNSGAVYDMVANTSGLRDAFITAAVADCVALGWRGIVVDIEGFGDWTTTTTNHYYDFLTDFSAAMKAAGKVLSVYIPPIWNTAANTESGSGDEWDGANSSSYYELDYASLNAITDVDYWEIPLYDYEFDYGAERPEAPLRWIADVANFAKSQFDDINKIVIGVSAQGHYGPDGYTSFTNWTYEEAAAQAQFSTALRDSESGELYWKPSTINYWIADDETQNIRRRLLESLGIRHMSIWYLGDNKYGSMQTKTEQSKTIIIETPSASEDISMFYIDKQVTVKKLIFVVTGTTSVTATLRHGRDRNATGTEVVTGGTVANSNTTGVKVTTLTNPIISEGSYVWLETTALSGTPTSLQVTVIYE